jgi:hypothetical protein
MYYRRNPNYANTSMPKPHQNLTVYLHLHSDSDNFPGRAPPQPAFRDEGALFCALGWHVSTSETLKQFRKARHDVKMGSRNIMKTVYTIGAEYLHVDVLHPHYRYKSFDPTGDLHIPQGTPGCYSSTMCGISDYIILVKHLEQAFQDECVRDMVLLAMYYDLMSHLAEYYTRSVSAGLQLLHARTTVVGQLVHLQQNADLAQFHDTINIMIIIARQIMPAPPHQHQSLLNSVGGTFVL